MKADLSLRSIDYNRNAEKIQHQHAENCKNKSVDWCCLDKALLPSILNCTTEKSEIGAKGSRQKNYFLIPNARCASRWLLSEI